MASDTGGHAFYNTNGLSDAVAKAIDAGSNYYTLTYNPTDHKWNGDVSQHSCGARREAPPHRGSSSPTGTDTMRMIHNNRPRPKRRRTADQSDTNSANSGALVDHAAEAYSQAAISRGAPQPEDILFKVRVLPLTGKNDDTLAPGNQANPNGKMKAPYRTFAVDYVALPDYFSLMQQSDGRHTGAIEFSTFVYDADGNLLNISDKHVIS